MEYVLLAQGSEFGEQPERERVPRPPGTPAGPSGRSPHKPRPSQAAEHGSPTEAKPHLAAAQPRSAGAVRRRRASSQPGPQLGPQLGPLPGPEPKAQPEPGSEAEKAKALPKVKRPRGRPPKNRGPAPAPATPVTLAVPAAVEATTPAAPTTPVARKEGARAAAAPSETVSEAAETSEADTAAGRSLRFAPILEDAARTAAPSPDLPEPTPTPAEAEAVSAGERARQGATGDSGEGVERCVRTPEQPHAAPASQDELAHLRREYEELLVSAATLCAARKLTPPDTAGVPGDQARALSAQV